ncbi:MAG: threonine aldolase family protein, partial [Bacteroidota bacterium]
LYEGGGLAFNSGLSVWLLDGNRGRITASQVEDAIRPDNVHYPKTSVVSLENTHNRGGGSIYSLSEIKAIREVCIKYGLSLHLDGARVFNALVEADYSAKELGDCFDTISICMSKGLGAPVGSVLVGTNKHIKEARRVRKVLGGGSRQAGFMAKACTYALDQHIDRLKDDHRRAKVLGETLSRLSFVKFVLTPETNIVVSHIHEQLPLDNLLSRLESEGIKAVAFGKQAMRMVTHLDFDDEMLQRTCDTLVDIDRKL